MKTGFRMSGSNRQQVARKRIINCSNCKSLLKWGRKFGPCQWDNLSCSSQERSTIQIHEGHICLKQAEEVIVLWPLCKLHGCLLPDARWWNVFGFVEEKDAVAQLVRAPICAFRMEACSNFINWTDNPEVAGSSPVGIPFMADIAQLVEHLLVAQGVVGSNPTVRPNYSERKVVKLVNTAVKKMIFVIKNLTAVYI